MGDLPDWYSQVVSEAVEATSIQGGLDANKSATPVSKDVYAATDTNILYICFTDGAWTNAGNLYLLLAGGTMTGAIAMGTKKITGLGAPAAAADAARKAEVDAVDAKLDDTSVSDVVGSRAVDTVYQNTSGKLLLVFCGFNWSGAGDIGDVQARIGSVDPPTTNCGRESGDQSGGGQYGGLTLLVPKDYYYAVYASGDSPSIDSWVEIELF